MAHSLPALPYALNGLEPHIDARTMEIHHTKHHQAYINNLNKALEAQPDLGQIDIAALCSRIATVPEAIRGPVRNNGGGHYNHSLFWTCMKGNGGGSPSGALATAIEKDLGGLAKFKEAFANAATTRFGSGWAWLGLKEDGKLCVCSTPNQDNPLMKGLVDCPCKPLLGLDVWEHAYYLNYQNRRPDYVGAWWNVVNWDQVAANFANARS